MKNIFASLLLVSTVIFFCSHLCRADWVPGNSKDWSGLEWSTIIYMWCNGSRFELLLQRTVKVSMDAYSQGALGTNNIEAWWKNGVDCIGLKPEAKFKKDFSIFPESCAFPDKSLDAIWEGGRQQAYSKGKPKVRYWVGLFIMAPTYFEWLTAARLYRRYGDAPMFWVSRNNRFNFC